MHKGITIPIFSEVHPLVIKNYLIGLGYDPLFFSLDFEKISTIKVTKKIVIIFMSFFEFLEFLKLIDFNYSKFIIAPSKKELDLFKDHSLLFDIYKEKNLHTFIPNNILLNHIKEIDFEYSDSNMPIDKFVDLLKELRKNERRPKRKTQKSLSNKQSGNKRNNISHKNKS